MKTISTLFIAALTALAMACGGSSAADTTESQSAGEESSAGDEMAAEDTGDDYAEPTADEGAMDDGTGDDMAAEEGAEEPIAE